MKLRHVRNATLIVETEERCILVAPMLGPAGTMPPFSVFKSKAKRNPIVGFPKESKGILEKVDHCLITHLHPDHLDKAGKAFLKERQIPITCSLHDEKALRKAGLKVAQVLDYWKEEKFLGGSILGTPATHGYGWVTVLAGKVMGFFITLPDECSLYLSSDTIYTDDVRKILNEYKPNISVLATGAARFDFGNPLLMTLDDAISFIHDSPGKVLANHMESINHCPVTRNILRDRLQKEGLRDKVWVPEDGSIIIP